MAYSLKGVNSDSDTCELCGKTGLKRVMWLEMLDDDGNGTGIVMSMGVCCGAKSLGLTGKHSSFEQVVDSIDLIEKKNKAIENAKEMAAQFNDEIAIIRVNNGYSTVRGKAFDANPNRYKMPVQWVTP